MQAPMPPPRDADWVREQQDKLGKAPRFVSVSASHAEHGDDLIVAIDLTGRVWKYVCETSFYDDYWVPLSTKALDA